MLWFVSAAALLGIYAVAELAARFWLRRRGRYDVWLPGLRRRLYPDRNALPEYEPVVRIEVNADGERGAAVHDADDPGLYRVLVAGGSAAEGLALDQAHNWPAVVERILGTPDSLRRLGATRVHVGTIGRSAVAAREVDLILERVLPRYRRLNAVVIMTGAADVVHWLACGTPTSPPPPPPLSEVFACHPEGPFGWGPSSSALVEVLKRWRWLALRPVDVRHNVGRWIVEARAMRAAATEIRTSVPDPGPLLDNFERYLGQMLERARARAQQVLVVRQPWFEKDYTPEEVAHFWHGGLGHPWKRHPISVYYALDVVNRLMALVDARAVQVAERLRIGHLDLRRVVEPSLDTYFDYTHFTPAGAKIVGEAVAAALLRQRAPQPSRAAPCVAEPARAS